ncbi:MAG: twin-arginine translocase TatA/TatE family subunit [Bdellovibrionaceae bacterium]|nr:twin-arginine translocase TatA/TatE family subunit [Pseudobdellovibrionaceae bacterium]
MGEFSLTHILLVAVIFLIFFGPSKLPSLGQSLGKAIRGFKEGLNEIEIDSKDITHQRLEKPQSRPENSTATQQQQAPQAEKESTQNA